MEGGNHNRYLYQPGVPAHGKMKKDRPPDGLFILLSVLAQEKHTHGAGTGVGADDCADVVNKYILNIVFFL